jgi:hypothetical protein
MTNPTLAHLNFYCEFQHFVTDNFTKDECLNLFTNHVEIFQKFVIRFSTQKFVRNLLKSSSIDVNTLLTWYKKKTNYKYCEEGCIISNTLYFFEILDKLMCCEHIWDYCSIPKNFKIETDIVRMWKVLSSEVKESIYDYVSQAYIHYKV